MWVSETCAQVHYPALSLPKTKPAFYNKSGMEERFDHNLKMEQKEEKLSFFHPNTFLIPFPVSNALLDFQRQLPFQRTAKKTESY